MPRICLAIIWARTRTAAHRRATAPRTSFPTARIRRERKTTRTAHPRAPQRPCRARKRTPPAGHETHDFPARSPAPPQRPSVGLSLAQSRPSMRPGGSIYVRQPSTASILPSLLQRRTPRKQKSCDCMNLTHASGAPRHGAQTDKSSLLLSFKKEVLFLKKKNQKDFSHGCGWCCGNRAGAVTLA